MTNQYDFEQNQLLLAIQVLNFLVLYSDLIFIFDFMLYHYSNLFLTILDCSIGQLTMDLYSMYAPVSLDC